MKQQGIVFNIQKFSIHDGPGIRTTVFLKGCPLKCKWCANPESQNKELELLYDEEKCIKCLKCLNSCPIENFSFSKNQLRIHRICDKLCFHCVHHCPVKALTFEGEYKSVGEVMEVILQDKDFYLESNGGVTLSGGEALLQIDFVKALCEALKKEKIHIAVETTGYIDHDLFKEVAGLFDLILFDVKHYDTNKHYEGTLVHNDLIIKNLKWIIDNKVNVLPRIPVIPMFNETLKDAYGFARLLNHLNINKVQLLPFHQFGENKYHLLNKEYEYENRKALYKEDLKDYQMIFITNGIDCFF